MCIDLQNLFVSACKNSESEIIGLIIILILEFGVDNVDIQSTIHTILEIPYRQDFVNKVIKLLLQCQKYDDSKAINIMSVIRKSYASCSKSCISKTNDLILWILRRCRHALIDMPETMLEICKCGDIDSINYLLNACDYGNIINASCIQTAFASGSIEMIEVLINYFPDIKFDKNVAMNNASLSEDISVVLWLFHKYSVIPNRLPVLEPTKRNLPST
ncbi:unnamed protein product [Mytilus coruscus]|uniref:Ankyrin repeat protein n=1 Tax=Mytilus coruscus TaxID=42192 RepID=A0A6J8EUH2_MYTCO|nr:unnamed protein product [Mytilus coruscus]